VRFVPRRCRARRFWISLACLMAASPAKSAEDSGKRKVTVADAIRMTVWADREYFLGGAAEDRVGLFSPDGEHFIVVVRRGNLDNNTNEYSLVLLRTKDAFGNPKPDVLLTLATSSNHEAIENVRWLNDNETIVFLGERVGETPEVFSFNTKTRRSRKITHHASPVLGYDISGDGRTIVYEAVPRQTIGVNPEAIRRNGVVITTQSPSDLFLIECNANQEIDRADRELFVQHGQEPAERVSVTDQLSEYLPLLVSPDGRYAVLKTYASIIPSYWAEYRDTLLHPYIVEPRKPGRRSNVTHYLLLDTRTGEVGPLLDAPSSWFNNGLVWAKNGRSLMVSGTYLPLDAADKAEREQRASHAFVAEVEVPSKLVIPVSDQPVKVADWNQRSGVLVLRPEDTASVTAEAYEKRGSSWEKIPTPEHLVSSKPLRVSLEEDSNTAPGIFVTSLDKQRRELLFDLNPQFANLTFGRVESVKWKGSDGHEVVGGLYFPPDYREGKRYPLVIQTHGFQEDRFWIDGPWSSAFAAQPLAAKEMMVLQVGSSADPRENRKYTNTPGELPRQMAAYEGAIDYLDERGLIDRNRVGIIGFSRTVSYVAYTLTHSNYPFAAATFADGFDAGYVNFLLFGGSDYAAVNGGLPFGSSLASWIQNSPGFNLDKIGTPVRLEYYGWTEFLGGWQTFSELSILKKPVDFVWLPYGMHLLVKPWERLVSQQGNVDWFNFWLNGSEDVDPSNAEQYERWEELRRQVSHTGR
jgi:dipeptidyl aminopeptidase/acylaminoacyl peptidase